MPIILHWPDLPTAMALDAQTVLVVAVELAVSPDRLEQCRGWLDHDELQRVARFQQDLHRHRYLAAHGGMREVLGRCLGVSPDRPRFRVGAHGKPALEKGEGVGESDGDNLHVNLSHSGDLALVALTRVGEVGVDVEQHRPGVACADLARRFFAAAETQALERLPPECREAGFFSCWSRKEAVVKALGTGLHTPLDRFAVAVDPRQPAGMRQQPDDWPVLHLAELPLPAGWSGAVAVAGPQGALVCRRLATD